MHRNPFDNWEEKIVAAEARFQEKKRKMQRDEYFGRWRHRGAEWIDEFWTPSQATYPKVRIGRSLLPETIPLDARRLISEFNSRPSQHSGLVPESRGRFRSPGSPDRRTNEDGVWEVACPICNRWYIADTVFRWIFVTDPNQNPPFNQTSEAYRDWQRAQQNQWLEYYTNHWNPQRPSVPNSDNQGMLVCSEVCKYEYIQSKKAQNKRATLASGQVVHFHDRDAHPPNKTPFHIFDWSDFELFPGVYRNRSTTQPPIP